MKNFSRKASLFWIFLCVGGDQFVKWAAIKELTSSSYEITSFFSLKLAFNQGMAFSLPLPMIVLVFLTGLFLGFLSWWFFSQKRGTFESWGMIFLLSGGIGNFIDRVFRGEVIDYLSVGNFPIFNLADIFINVGIGIFLGLYFWKPASCTLFQK